MFDAVGLEQLSEEECFRLLGQVSVGRIVFTNQALPAIQPVTFAVRGRSLIVRTSAGSRLATAVRNAVVAFEADEFSGGHPSDGWSVVAVGHAAEITDPAALLLARGLGLPPWALEIEAHYIKVDIELISGRRVAATPAAVSLAKQDNIAEN
jgi:nitroimidazol reductase NimA-like FMN-containing flavoprotein (pyridoxamine 5'-phosphate oxidase superfamily)